MRMNKKGASLSGWSEASLFLILFMSLMAIVIVNMNAYYSQNNDPTFGIATNSTQSDLTDYQDTLKQSINSGTASSSALGFSVSTTWNVISTGIGYMWSFLTGGWIERSVGLLHMGEAGTALAVILRIIYILSVGFIFLKLVLRIKP